MGRVCQLDALARIRAALRQVGASVVLTNGCFDLLHVGHVRCLQAARHLGDCLIVGVNADAQVRRLKGPRRPVVPEDERAEVVAALGCVDYVVVFHEETAGPLVARLRPDVYAKGADYGPGGRELPEAAIVRAYGGRVALLALTPGRSTSAIVARLTAPGPPTPAEPNLLRGPTGPG